MVASLSTKNRMGKTNWKMQNRWLRLFLCCERWSKKYVLFKTFLVLSQKFLDLAWAS